MTPRGRRQRGFTLVEMLAVLAVLALIAAVSTPLLRPPADNLILERVAREMSAAMRATRARALLRNEETDFVIDVARNVYSAPGVAATRLPVDAAVTLIVARLERSAAEAARDTRQTVRFYPDGTSSGAEITLQLRRVRMELSVNWLTGQTQASP